MSVGSVTPQSRPTLRSVALPAEHGGWGLTLEPGLLGLLVAPSMPGACIAAAAMVAFVVRTPLKLVVIDRRRGRWLPRTSLALGVALFEIAVLAALVAAALALAEPWFWIPAAVAAPFLAIEMWFEVRSRGRRLVPELAGAIAVSSVTAMVVLAEGGEARLAVALWMVLAGRVITSIPFVREQIARLHSRPISGHDSLVADTAALIVVACAVMLELDVMAGALAVFGLVLLQRAMKRQPVPRPMILGLRQMAMGFGVVLVTAAGVLVMGGT